MSSRRKPISAKLKRELLKEKRDKDRQKVENETKRAKSAEEERARAARRALKQANDDDDEDGEGDSNDDDNGTNDDDGSENDAPVEDAPRKGLSSKTVAYLAKKRGEKPKKAGGAPTAPTASSSGGGGVEESKSSKSKKFVRKLYYDPDKLKTVFASETKEDIEKRKAESRKPYRRILTRTSEAGYYSETIDIPVRPAWTVDMTKAQIEAQEDTYFRAWLAAVYAKYPAERLNHFEHNLEVWRQLWRVAERSHVLLVLVDVRHPLFNFPPSLYNYITHHLGKPMVMILTKIDMVSRSVVDRWVTYFTQRFPRLRVVPFSSRPQPDTVTNETKDARRRKIQLVTGGLIAPEPYGADQLLECCRSLVDEAKRSNLSFTSTHVPTAATPAAPSLSTKSDDNDDDDDANGAEGDDEEDEEAALKRQEADDMKAVDNSVITLGCIGHPNAGKSSLINALARRKLVSVSKTPGHTKYYQTLYLNKSTMLCDCPGLVFPAVDMPKALQVLCGIYPISQTREPYTAVQYLAQRMPLPTIYNLKPPVVDDDDDDDDDEDDDTPAAAAAARRRRAAEAEEDDDEYRWSAWSICESYCIKKGYRTKKGALDTHRAANHIIQDAINGAVVLYFEPPPLPPASAAAAAPAVSTAPAPAITPAA